MSKKRKNGPLRVPVSAELPAPLVPADVDLRDTPPPVNLFIEMAMAQFGWDRATASRNVHDIIATSHGAKGNA